MKVKFRPMISSDWNSVAAIYKQGIETGNATFEKEMPAWELARYRNGNIYVGIQLILKPAG